MKRTLKVLPALLLMLLCQAVYAEVKNGEASFSSPKPELYSYKVISIFPHDPEAFTQGLAVDNGILYEGTGRYGQSSIRRVDLKTGGVTKVHHLATSLFGEGITVMGDRIIQLTWKSQFGLVYDKHTFSLLRIFSYQGEGWGISHDGTMLMVSDGTDTIRFLHPETFKEMRRVQVTDAGVPVRFLNELEYVQGSILANVWKSDRIAIIDPQTGRVTGWLDLTGMRPDQGKEEEVLNGIAYDPEKGALYVTGKMWPNIFQIEMVPQISER